MNRKSEYKWIPKNGISLDAVERMQKHFHKHKYPMGEAWFIGKEFNDTKDFIPTENAKCFLEVINKNLTDELILDWAESFTQDKFVAESTFNTPEQFLEKLSKSN